ncbi:MAG: CoA-disulfide reductase [Elusimicrobiota bacterium]
MKVLIIGGVAGGATSAARLRRMDENARIILFEKDDHISYANCGLPYYTGGVIKNKENILLQTPESFRDRYNVDVRVKNEVTDINRKKKEVVVRDLATDREYTESYDKIILSSGSEVLLPPIEGIENNKVFTVRNVADGDKIKNFIEKENPEHATVVGGGYIGLEMAENLYNRGINITILEMAGQLVSPLDFEMSAEVHRHLKSKNIEFYLKEELVKIEDKDGRLNTEFKSGKNLDTDMIIVSVGIKPNTRLAKRAGLKLAESGGIKVDRQMRTSDEDIYALGDAVEIWDPVFDVGRNIPLAGPANKQARIVADNIATGESCEFKGAVGTAIAKVFDISVGVTGFSAKFMEAMDMDYESVIIHRADHAGYYPGSNPLSIKINFNDEGKLLGGQVVGFSGVDKATETLSVIRQNGLTVDELKDMEQAYAPPFSSAKSPVNIAGFVADNVLKNRAKFVSWEAVEKASPEDTVILDVRTEDEVMLGKIPGSVNIPVNELRENLDSLPQDQKIYVYCSVGQRSYVAARILLQNGFEKVYNISGGYKTWENATMKQSNENLKEGLRVEKDDMIYSASEAEENIDTEANVSIDATGLQCPGPIMKLNNRIKDLEEGTVIEISSSDPGFYMDVKSWSSVTGNSLLRRSSDKGVFRAAVKKRSGGKNKRPAGPGGKEKTLVVFNDDLDRALASFVIANGALAMGKEVTIFFTFWGLNVIKKDKVKVKKDFISKLFSLFMPKNASKLKLSKMNFGGLGSKMMKRVMKKKNIETLETLIKKAQKGGARFIACQMSMEVMGIKEEELIEGTEVGGVASYIEATEDSNLNLFI